MKNANSALVKHARCCVYIDGFNCYFRVFRHRPEWKWLNIQSFYENLRSSEDVISIRYFTAIVEPKKPFSETRNRQMLYLNALRTLSKVSVILGKYQDREVRCLAHCGDGVQRTRREKDRREYRRLFDPVYIPTLAPPQERGTSFYKSIGVACRDLPLGDIHMHLFPEMVQRPDGSNIQRPASWVAGR